MRVESDREGHHGSEAPACHRCGVPLLDGSTYCPYCERWLDDDETGASPHREPIRARLAGRISERALVDAGLILFGTIAVVCLIVALVLAV